MLSKVILTIEYNPDQICTQCFNTIANMIRMVMGIGNVHILCIHPEDSNLHWGRVTFPAICKALGCNHARGESESEFDTTNKNDIKEAHERQSQVALIKVVRRMSGLDLLSAKRWVETYLSTP